MSNETRHRILVSENIAFDDLEDSNVMINVTGDGRIHDDELLSFVGVIFSNEQISRDCKSNGSTHPEVNRHGAE